MAINVGKLLPPSKSGNIVSRDIAKRMASPVDDFSMDKPSLNPAKNRPNQILVIRTQVIKIENLVKRKYVEDTKKQKEENKSKEEYKRRKKEEKLEEKPRENEKLPNNLRLPKIGFLDGIKNFIVNMILGFVAFRLIEYLPAIAKFAKVLAPAVDFFIDFSGKLLNGLVSFVDWGYKAYDSTRKQLSTFGGENFTKIFDTFNGAVGKVIEAAITTAIVLGNQGDGGVFDIGRDIVKDRLLQKGAQQAATTAAGQAAGQASGIGAGAAGAIVAGAGLLASAIGEGAFQLKKLGRSQEEKQRKAFEKEKNPLLKGILWLGYQQGRFGNFMLGNIGVLLDIVGAPFRYAIELIRYPFLSAKDKEKQKTNLGKLDARIRDQFRENLNNVTSMFGVQLKEGSFGSLYGNKATSDMYGNKMAGGGQPITRGGRVVGGRTSRKYKKPTSITRQIQTQPTKLKSGKDVGGEKKIEKVFPKSPNKDFISPLGYLEESYSTTSKIPFFGPLFGIATKVILGEKPNSVDYKNVGVGLNSWINTTFSGEVLRTGGAFAGGGEVNAEMFMKGEDLTNVIAKSVQESVSSKIDDTINELMKQLMLKEIEKKSGVEGKDQPTGEGDILHGTTSGEYGPILDLIASVEAVGGYDVVNGGKIDGLSKMTISQARQAALRSGGSGAMGRYQQMPQFVLSRARSVGLNPDTDLFNEENQNKLAILLIDGAGYKRWKSGEMSTEQFAHNLSATWRGLPEGPSNLTYQDQYASGNKAHTSWANVMATLSAVKSGKISGGQLGGGILGTGRLSAVDQFTSIASKFGLQMTSDYRSGDRGYHGKNRARDYSNDTVGNGTPQQLAFAKHLLSTYGSSLTQLIYTPLGFGIANGKKVPLSYWGEKTNAGHYNHVHVALAKGGLVGGITYAMLGERGREFVLDSNTTEALRGSLPGFLEALNSAKNVSGALAVIQSYMSYDDGSPQNIIIEDDSSQDMDYPFMGGQKLVPIAMGGMGGSSGHDHFEILDRLPG